MHLREMKTVMSVSSETLSSVPGQIPGKPLYQRLRSLFGKPSLSRTIQPGAEGVAFTLMRPLITGS